MQDDFWWPVGERFPWRRSGFDDQHFRLPCTNTNCAGDCAGKLISTLQSSRFLSYQITFLQDGQGAVAGGAGGAGVAN